MASTGEGMSAEVARHIIVADCATEGGKYHGNGVIAYCNNNTYKGDLTRGKLHGKGQLTWKDAVQYEGAFRGNVITGVGSYVWPDGGTYHGELLKGKRHGKGVYTKGVLTYQGEWRDGRKHGLGVLYYNQQYSCSYKGEFKGGVRDGWGSMVYESGSVYEGEWRGDKMNGYGVMQWVIPGLPVSAGTVLHSRDKLLIEAQRGDVFEGTTTESNDLPIVNTSIPLALSMPATDTTSGRVETYEGKWKNSAPHGYGIYTWLCKAKPRGNVVSRPFRPNSDVGACLSSMETPLHGENTYKGWFTNGKRNGKGILSLADGVVFEGTWANNVKQGSGVLMHPDGRIELLTLLSDVIQAKKVLQAGLTTCEEGAVQFKSATQGLPVNEQESCEAVGLGIYELLDCNEEDEEIEYSAVRDFLKRCLPQMKFLYKFYATVGTTIPLKTPSDINRDDKRRARYEKVITRKVRSSAVSAEEAAFAKEPDFIARKLVKPPEGAAHKPRRERLLMQLHEATHLIVAEAVEVSKQAAQQKRPDTAGTLNESTPGPSPEPGGYSAVVSPVGLATEKPSTLMHLHQLWSLLKDSGICDSDLTLWKSNRILAKLLSQQPQCRDDLTCLSSDEDSEGTEVDAASHSRTQPRLKKRRHSEAPTSASAPVRTQRNSSLSSRGDPTAAGQGRVPSARIFKKGYIAKVRRQQEADPDDPQTTIIFPVFVQCIVKLAHIKGKFTTLHAYNNATKCLSLRDRVLWLLSTYLQPLVDSLHCASESPAGTLLGLPTLVQPVPANVTHKTDTSAKKRHRPSSATSTLNRGETFRNDNPESDVLVEEGDAKATLRRKKSEIPHVAVNDKIQKCGGETVTLTTTSVTQQWSEVPAGTIYTETRGDYGTVCLGLHHAAAHVRESEWDARHREAWTVYQDARDTVEEYTHQQKEDSQGEVGGRITSEQFDSAQEILNTLELPNRFSAEVAVDIMLKTAPVLEKMSSAAEFLIQRYEEYKRYGAFTMQSLVKLLADYRLVGGTPVEEPNTKLKQLACKLSKNEGNKSAVEQMLRELEEEEEAAGHLKTEFETWACTQSTMRVLRPCLWYAMHIDIDEVVQRGADLNSTGASHLTQLCATMKSIKSIRSLQEITIHDEDVPCLPSDIKSLLVARDEVKANPSWFPPPRQPSKLSKPSSWSFSSLPILYHEYVQILALLSSIVYRKEGTPSEPHHVKLQCSSLPRCFAKLVGELSRPPPEKHMVSVPNFPLRPQALLPAKPRPEPVVPQKATGKK